MSEQQNSKGVLVIAMVFIGMLTLLIFFNR